MKLRLLAVAAALLLLVASATAGEIANADLDIIGLGLEVDPNPVVTAVDVPAYVQTIFGGRSNADAPPANGLAVLGDLTGPGIDTPITLSSTPGGKFALPALHEKGEYALQNIRLVSPSGEYLQSAVPSFATINVTEVLQTQLRVRQLTAEDLRERGISVDARNYDVYEYTIVLTVNGEQVEIPYPVIIDKRTHEVASPPGESRYVMPPIPINQRPPRVQAPDIAPFDFGPSDVSGNDIETGTTVTRPSIPAALVIPNGFGVLHQFFAVVVQIANGAPPDSNIRLDGITAQIDAPLQMRVAKVVPAVALGQPVQITDSATGATFLVAGAEGSAEWSLEALRAGTHTISFDLRATYQKPGQEDVPMHGKVSTAIVVSDPRFQVNFSHPDTVRKDEKYSAYSFITNLSAQSQHVVLDMSRIPACTSGAAVDNICRVDGTTATTEIDLAPGEMKPVPYRLESKITGHVFASASVSDDDTVATSVTLTMGVSESGIPLSPATLVMPYYARYVPDDVVDANLQLLGLGYSLATAPLNENTAKFPRVIKTDVFYRAQQIARAGQRIFITRANRDVANDAENRDALFNLSLDLVGNIERIDQISTAPELLEWDQLRRSEDAGRRAAAAMSRQFEAIAAAESATPATFIDSFAAATSHRSPYLLAYVHGAAGAGVRPYAISLTGLSTTGRADLPAEAGSGWTRSLSCSELTSLNIGGESGELAMTGCWKERIRVSVIAASPSFSMELIYPDSADGHELRATISVENATPGQPVTFDLTRGSASIDVNGATALATHADAVEQTPLRVAGAAQDLYRDPHGHVVSLLFNRAVLPGDVATLRDHISLTTTVAKANYISTRRNVAGGELQVPGAAIQDDAEIVNVTFDKSLSRNAAYSIGIDGLRDLVTGSDFSTNGIVPRVDNDRPGGILTGRVLHADNTSVPNVPVVLETGYAGRQIDLADRDGRYLFDWVPRDVDNGILGDYELSATADAKSASVNGSVRLPGEVHTVNLVFLGRGRARGQVRYDDGTPIGNVAVTIGSTLFNQVRRGVTDANGNYEIGDLPVGPLTFSVVDADGRPTFAANQIRTAGEVVEQDLVVVRRQPPGRGTIRIIVRRSDTSAVVPNAGVAIWMQGYALREESAGLDGTFVFDDVPAGLVTLNAWDFGLSRTSAAVEVELGADQTVEQVLVIGVAPANTEYASLEGIVTRDDPAAPGDETKDTAVAGAIVTIGRLPAVTANADGSYVFPDLTPTLPGTIENRTARVFDPSTGRSASFALPTLNAGSNHFSPRLQSAAPAGHATMRVRLHSAKGDAVPGYRVFMPGFPPQRFTETTSGTYELADVRVPQQVDVVATAASDGAYGDQVATGSVRADFDGQVGVSDLYLPGAGTIVVRVEIETSCSTPPCYAPAPGTVAMTYGVWSDADQNFVTKKIEGQPDPATGLVTFSNVPARQSVGLATVGNAAGYASAQTSLGFDADVRNVTLRLATTGDVSGRVLMYDGITPVANATVRLINDRATYAPAITAPDGTFRFSGLPADLHFRVIADLEADGIYRTGYADGATPPNGGPSANLVITMREQSGVEGQVVDSTTGAPVPLARFWLRELAWPYRSFGTQSDPLQADLNGRFIVSNVFAGDFRITAVSPENQEVRGDYQGRIAEEGDGSQRDVHVSVGGVGLGAISVTVLDPLLSFTPVENAEVSLYRGGYRFDFQTTDSQGVVVFEDVPVDTYSVGAYSKTVGRAGGVSGIHVDAGQTTATTVHLEYRGRVAGDVKDPESEPTPGAPAKGIPVEYSGSIRTNASTDTTGAFEFLGVPEGLFQLVAREPNSGRIAKGPDGLYISKLVPEQTNIHLQLDRTATLTVKVFLPDDAGNAGDLAPLAEVTVWEGNLIWGPVPYYRTQQGNTLSFPKMLRHTDYGLEVKELGGDGRVVRTSGHLGDELTREHDVVLPASGSVETVVVDGNGNPVSDARVSIRSAGPERVLYTGGDGHATVSGIPLGWVSAQAVKDNVSAAAGGNLQSRSTPLRLAMNLGTSATAEGFVETEQGIGVPSAGTRVVLSVTSRLIPAPLHVETLTDSNGRYRFTGIPAGGTSLSFLFYGPDDTTVGATRTLSIADGTTGTVTVPPVKLDATPAQVLSIDPPANATNVAPSTAVSIVFSEPIAASFLTGTWFQLIATDDGSHVACTIETTVKPDGTFVVRLIPPPPPASQKFPLRSNTMYRLFVPAGLQDTTGNGMRVSVGSAFTTVNYTEPAVIRIDPSEALPIPQATTFHVTFNKAIDLSSFDAGNGGVATLERLDSYKGNPVATVAVTRYLDPASASTLVVAPTGEAIAESSFYRLTIAGVRDTQTPPNVQKDPRVFEFFSYDTHKPVVTIDSPAASDALTTGVLYTASAHVTDGDSGNDATDTAFVDWFDGSGALLSRIKTAPFGYTFTAPAAQAFTLKATATDLSGNMSEQPAVVTWTVQPNVAPQGLVVTNTPDAVYPTGHVQTRVHFADEGLVVTVSAELVGTAIDGTALRQFIGSQKITRPSTGVAFADAVFDYAVPLTFRSGAASVDVSATDSANNTGTASAPLTISEDTIQPQIVSLVPAAETHYQFGQTYAIEISAKDGETGLAHALVTVDGKSVLDTATGAYDPSTGITRFRTTITVPPKNADTRVPIVATVTDNRGNVATLTHEVIYDRVDDETIPKAAWITPLDGAALPANLAGWPTTLRVRATDDTKVTAVRFESSALASPVILDAPVAGTSDVFEAKVALTMPADRSSFVITATVSDGDPSHDVALPITITPVDVSPVITTDIAISSINANQYAGHSIAVRGAKVYITQPLEVRDLLLLDGATLSNPEETPLDVTVDSHVFVDVDSRVDVTEKGYLGGWRQREDHSFTNGQPGRTIGGLPVTGGVFASASHAGLGGFDDASTTNPTYGSIQNPVDLGSGGNGAASCCSAGGNGGGAFILRDGTDAVRVVIAGAIRADGGTGVGRWGSGSGGSVNISARDVITSSATRITANGGDDDEGPTARGGGGGRIAIHATERLDVDPAAAVLQARGGRNGSSDRSDLIGAGAGTLFIGRPRESSGELVVSSFDERLPLSHQLTMGTPLGGDLTFDAITVGPRALARFDSPYSLPSPDALTVDGTANVELPDDVPAISITRTTPADGSSVPQSTAVSVAFTASSPVGVYRSIASLSASTSVVPVIFSGAPATTPETTSTINVPAAAAPGSTELRLQVVDRAGRVVEASAAEFGIVANDPPALGQFDVVPVDETYANATVNVTARATDDVAVTSLALASSAGTIQSDPPQTANGSTTRHFVVSIPASTASGTAVVLTLSASDGFAGRAPTTATHTVTIRKDLNAPSLTVTKPQPGDHVQEGSGAKFVVEANAVDAEVGVSDVSATFDGVTRAMNLVAPDTYQTSFDVPQVDGSDSVSKSVSIAAKDYDGNVVSKDVSIAIDPLIDPNAPTLSWACSSPDAMYPVSYDFPIRVTAVPSSSANGVTSVQVSIDGASAPITASVVGTNTYEARYAIPAGTPDGTNLKVRVVARSVSGNESDIVGSVMVVSGTQINTRSTITATDLSFENASIIVREGGDLTIVGAHTLKNVVVLNGGVLRQSPNGTSVEALNIDRGFISCGGSIDVTGQGYGDTTSYPGAVAPYAWVGGSHIGHAGHMNHGYTEGLSYGSVYRPAEKGGGGYQASLAGGGVLRIGANTLLVDGAIRANGIDNPNSRAAAGGSIWLTTSSIRGAGVIEARGGDALYEAGGGGAIAVEFSDPASRVPQTSVRGGVSAENAGVKTAGAGSVYVRGPASTYGDLTVDDGNKPYSNMATLSALGGGLAQPGTSGATLVTDRSADVPTYFIGGWVRITSSTGAVRGTWQILSVSGKSVTLSPSDSPVVISVGDTWQGVYRFDNVTVKGAATLVSRDPLEIGGTLWVGGAALNTQTLAATNVQVASGGTIRGYATWRLALKVPGELRVDANGLVDMTWGGYGNYATYPGARAPYAWVAGSHIGHGGDYGSYTDSATYGSVYRPAEPGGGPYQSDTYGGGVIRIQSGSVVVDGTIRSNGGNNHPDRSAAGGSIWLTTNAIRGNGSIEAQGADATYEAGGGGAIAVEYSDPASVVPHLSSRGGRSTENTRKDGGAGSAYVKGPASTHGDLTVDTEGVPNSNVTDLPPLGSGIAQSGSSGSTLVTDRASDVPPYFVGHWVELGNANGSYGLWRVAAVNGRVVTLEPNSQGVANVSSGDYWRGVYRFDRLSSNAWFVSADPLFVNGNMPPVVVPAKLSIISAIDGDYVVGSAGAVSDSEAVSIVLTGAHGGVYRGSANVDGSFRIAVGGPTGETFSIVATDTNPWPLSSYPLAVPGAIINTDPLVSLSAMPMTVSEGATLSLAVRLQLPARNGGGAVALSASDPAVAVPPSLVVAAGNTTASVVVNVGSVSSTTPVTISATSGGVTKSIEVTVVPAAANIRSVAVAPAPIVAGTSGSLTVSLNRAAPVGGAVIALRSSDAALMSVPSTVTIAEGETDVVIAVAAAGISQSLSVTISATYGNTVSTVVDVTPCSVMSEIAQPDVPEADLVWVDESPTGGDVLSGDASFDSTFAATGSTSLHFVAGSGERDSNIAFATPKPVAAGDRLVSYLLVNPCNPPREVLFVWSDGASEYRSSWGEDVIQELVAHKRMGSMPDGGEWVRLETLASAIGAAGKSIRSMRISVYDGEAWIDHLGTSACVLPPVDEPATFSPYDVVWFDDSLPAGAIFGGPDGGWTVPWSWDSAHAASGTQSNTDGLRAGGHQHLFVNATDALRPDASDVLFTYVFLDPCNPPREVFLQWLDGNWEHRAYWGEDLMLAGTNGTESRRRMGPLPELGKWVRLEVPASFVGLDGHAITGFSCGLFDGRGWFDRGGKASRINLALNKTASQSSTYSDVRGTYPAALAVDGVLTNDWIASKQATTTYSANPWWEVDLGAVYPIDTIDIRGRTDCCRDQTKNFVVFVSDTPINASDIGSARAQAGVSAYSISGEAGTLLTLNIRRSGRYVRIWRNDTMHLTLAEVMVWAAVTAQKSNLAGGGRPTSSPYYLSYFPEYAVNGSTNDPAGGVGNVFHSGNQVGTFWQLDLGVSYPISSIDVSSRTDCCPDQLREFYVMTSDVPFASADITTTLADTNVWRAYQATFLPVASVPVNRTARYVRVQRLTSTSALVIAEVQVWSQQAKLQPLSILRPAVNVSLASPDPKHFDFARDGRIEMLNAGSVSQSLLSVNRP